MREPPCGVPVETASIELGSVIQHMARSDDANKQHARTVPEFMPNSCWEIPTWSEVGRRTEVRGMMTARSGRGSTAASGGSIKIEGLCGRWES